MSRDLSGLHRALRRLAPPPQVDPLRQVLRDRLPAAPKGHEAGTGQESSH